MPLLEHLAEKTVEITREGRARIAVCAALRVSCEGWLKVELLKGFSELLRDSDEAEILPEADDFDLTVRAKGHQVRIELKTFPTNYGSGGKPISNFIDGVVRDLSKLASCSKPTNVGLAVWLAYPIPEPVPRQWTAHFERVRAASAGVLLSERIPLWESNFAHLYIMTSN